MASYDRTIKGDKKEDGKKKGSFRRDSPIFMPEHPAIYMAKKKPRYTQTAQDKQSRQRTRGKRKRETVIFLCKCAASLLKWGVGKLFYCSTITADSKSFRLCGPYATTLVCCCSSPHEESTSHKQTYINEWAGLCSNTFFFFKQYCWWDLSHQP